MTAISITMIASGAGLPPTENRGRRSFSAGDVQIHALLTANIAVRQPTGVTVVSSVRSRRHDACEIDMAARAE